MLDDEVPKLLIAFLITTVVLSIAIYQPVSGSIVKGSSYINIINEGFRLPPLYLSSGEADIYVITDKPVSIRIYAVYYGLLKFKLAEKVVDGYRELHFNSPAPSYILVELSATEENVNNLKLKTLVEVKYTTNNTSIILHSTIILGLLILIYYRKARRHGDLKGVLKRVSH